MKTDQSSSYPNTFAAPECGLKPLCLRVPEALKMIGVGRTKFYELVNSGEIETIKLGKSTLVPIDSLEALIERHRKKQDR